MKIRILLLAAITLYSSQSQAWGPAHIAMTRAALDVQDEECKALWKDQHIDPIDKTRKPLSWFLTNRFTMHPDAVDGPCRNDADIPRRLRATQFVFAERGGKYMVPIAYSDPDKDSKGPRPKTYHYFTLKTEELNRIFAEKGARWYFEKITEALKDGRKVDAAEYLGAFAHAIEDRVSPYHVWDGFEKQREAVETKYPELQTPQGSWKGKPTSASLIWALGGKDVQVDLGTYRPRILGKTSESAASEFTRRLFQSREHAREIYSRDQGFIAAHLKDDWQNRKAGPATAKVMSEVATENSRLVADVFRTAWELSR